MLLAILADDLTGALDAAAPFADRHFQVEAWIEGVTAGLERRDGPDVLAVDTGTRSASPREAGLWVSRAAQVLQHSGAEAFYKKIDSTLRGPWAEEIAAVRATLGAGPTIVCPAFPAQGRVVSEGRVICRGGVAGDCTDTLRRRAGPVALLPALGGLDASDGRTALRSGTGGKPHFIVADADTEDDLAALVRAAQHEGLDRLLCGSAGLAEAWAAALRPRPRPILVQVARVASVLVVVGSKQATSRRQLAALRRVIEHDRAVGAVTVLDSPTPMDSEEAIAQQLAALAEEAVSHHLAQPFRAFVLTGGATASAVLTRLGACRLAVEVGLEPGIAASRPLEGTAEGCLVITKAGGFGDDACLARIVGDLLETHPR